MRHHRPIVTQARGHALYVSQVVQPASKCNEIFSDRTLAIVESHTGLKLRDMRHASRTVAVVSPAAPSAFKAKASAILPSAVIGCC